MVAVNPRALLEKLNSTCKRVLIDEAIRLCMAQTNYYVEIEHWLLKLLDVANIDLARIVRHYDVDPGRLKKELMQSIDSLNRGNAKAPGFSQEILKLVTEAWTIASLEFNSWQIRSGHLLTALLNEPSLARQARGDLPELGKINGEDLQKNLKAFMAGSDEEKEERSTGVLDSSTSGPRAAPGGSKTLALDQFTMNLTDRARKGEIDPVIGRDFEIRQVIDILTRRRQNNPILTGEAGVGKTAVVEGFAQRIVAGDVPASLKNVTVRTLDLGLLQAGAGVKGEFENRLKSVIAEVKASPQPVILFIDEAHTIIGTGGAAGQGDAANLLKPALARGELRTIAATTWAEYKKYFETDAALKRRFQVVKVEEPDIAKGVRMMRGLTATLENHHKVRILNEAVEDAVKLSHRYITDRQLPDKSVSLLDTACAKVALGQSSTPPALEDCRREIEQLNVEISILEREKVVGADHDLRLQEASEKKARAGHRLAGLEKHWTEEKRLVTEMQKIRSRLETATAPDQKDQLKSGEEDKLRGELTRLEKDLKQCQEDTPLVAPVVNSQAVAEVVSGWTGIPLGKMVLDEIKTVLSLREKLEERIIGQSHALEAVAQRIRTARANLVDPRRPIGVFLMVGPSGVGKTETAVALSEILYGGDRNMVVINMSEYKEEHMVSRLKGTAKGYVGYGEGGVLTEAVRRKPYSIVLLDEVEKAHQSVQELFYQVFDKGMLQDDVGNDVDFKNTIIILTSNVGTDKIMKLCADPDTRPDAEGLAGALREDLLKAFKPALLGRLTIVPYFPLSDDVLRKIIELQLRRITERMRGNHRAAFTYDETVVGTIAGRCKEVASGARNVDHILTGTLLPEISRDILTMLAEGQAVQRAHVGVDGEGKFVYQVN